jgi:hypothetical protein
MTGCPTCGRTGMPNERVRVRKGGIRRVKSPNGWGVRKGTPRKSMRVYWEETTKRRDGVWAKCPDPYHGPRKRGPYLWPPMPTEDVDPSTLPVVTNRPPKARKKAYEQQSKDRIRRHLQNQSKQRR